MSQAKKTYFHITVVFILILCIQLFLPTAYGLTETGKHVLCVMISAIYLWLTVGTGWVSLISIVANFGILVPSSCAFSPLLFGENHFTVKNTLKWDLIMILCEAVIAICILFPLANAIFSWRQETYPLSAELQKSINGVWQIGSGSSIIKTG